MFAKRCAVQEQRGRGEPYDVRIIEDRWATFRHIIEAIAIVAAGVWAFYTFVYQEKIKPAGQPAALAISVKLYELRHTAQQDIIGIDIGFHNSGQTEIDIAADGFSIWGERFTKKVVERRLTDAYDANFDRDLDVASKTVLRSSMELRDMAAGGRTGTHIILEPADNETIVHTIAIPHGAYDLLYARVIAVPLKTSETVKVPVAVKRQPDGSYWLAFPPKSDGVEDDNVAFFSVPQ